jgi:hypothetical protein
MNDLKLAVDPQLVQSKIERAEPSRLMPPRAESVDPRRMKLRILMLLPISHWWSKEQQLPMRLNPRKLMLEPKPT